MKDARKHVKVGDYVTLNNELTGKVKWIGISDVTNNELIGIGLDFFNSMGNYGTIGNRRYFIVDVDEGFGIYVSREDISQCVAPPRPLVSRDISQAETDTLKRKQRVNEAAKAKERKHRNNIQINK